MSMNQLIFDTIKDKDKRIQEKEVVFMSDKSIAEFKAILKGEEYKIASGYCKH